jgi:DNA repair ATPase RecN
MPSFWISRVRAVGKKVPPAEVSFGANLNVISGASDTGKSYILQCINYMLGVGKSPEVR